MKINKICIIGAGIMGVGIAQVSAQAGFDVTLQDVNKKVLKQLDDICKNDTVFASNTSALSITGLASAVSCPGRVVGMHFFNPVPVMKLVELINGFSTTDDTLEIARSYVEKIGKTSIEVEEAPGFAVNRIPVPILNEAYFAFGEGVASARDIDEGMKLGANHPMGPLELSDMIGLDIILLIIEGFHKEFREDKYRPAIILKKMVRAGHSGRKSGRGFYDYG